MKPILGIMTTALCSTKDGSEKEKEVERQPSFLALFFYLITGASEKNRVYLNTLRVVFCD